MSIELSALAMENNCLDPLDTIEVANWFVGKAARVGNPITAMKLQKLIYYAHGWCLGLWEKPLVAQQVEAWTWGPVFSDVYHAVKHNGTKQITQLIRDEYGHVPAIPENDPRIPLLKQIWKIYSPFTAIQLSNMTHEKDSPWDKTRNKNPGRRGTDIEDNILIEHFRQKARQGNNQKND